MCAQARAQARAQAQARAAHVRGSVCVLCVCMCVCVYGCDWTPLRQVKGLKIGREHIVAAIVRGRVRPARFSGRDLEDVHHRRSANGTLFARHDAAGAFLTHTQVATWYQDMILDTHAH